VATVVNLSDLVTSFFYIDGGAAAYGNRAYVCRLTGRTYCVSDEFPGDEDVPEDLDDSDQYVAVPDRHELDLGVRLVRRFAEENLGDDDAEKIMSFFRHKGAYGRMKEFLAERGKLEAWHRFEEAEMESALRAWCEEQGWEVDETKPRA
jgi:hypothetical protein